MILTPEQQSNFNRYEELKGIIKEAEAEIKKLQPSILPIVPEDKEMLTDNGYFYIQKRPKWTFSEQLTLAEEALKESKEDEIAKGIATAEYTNTLYYKTGRPKPAKELED